MIASRFVRQSRSACGRLSHPGRPMRPSLAASGAPDQQRQSRGSFSHRLCPEGWGKARAPALREARHGLAPVRCVRGADHAVEPLSGRNRSSASEPIGRMSRGRSNASTPSSHGAQSATSPHRGAGPPHRPGGGLESTWSSRSCRCGHARRPRRGTTTNQPAHQLAAGASREGPALIVLDRARRLADEQDALSGVAAEDRMGSRDEARIRAARARALRALQGSQGAKRGGLCRHADRL